MGKSHEAAMWNQRVGFPIMTFSGTNENNGIAVYIGSFLDLVLTSRSKYETNAIIYCTRAKSI